MARRNDKSEEARVNAVIDRILLKDRRHLSAKEYPRKCQKELPSPNYSIESSSRFSLKVMEAMRSLQRGGRSKSLASSTANEIVNYIEKNYRNDGDLCAQVRTVLTQACCQGFIIETGMDEYHLVGPFACMLNNASCADCGDGLLPSAPTYGKRKRKKKKCRKKGKQPQNRVQDFSSSDEDIAEGRRRCVSSVGFCATGKSTRRSARTMSNVDGTAKYSSCEYQKDSCRGPDRSCERTRSGCSGRSKSARSRSGTRKRMRSAAASRKNERDEESACDEEACSTRSHFSSDGSARSRCRRDRIAKRCPEGRDYCKTRNSRGRGTTAWTNSKECLGVFERESLRNNSRRSVDDNSAGEARGLGNRVGAMLMKRNSYSTVNLSESSDEIAVDSGRAIFRPGFDTDRVSRENAKVPKRNEAKF